MSTKYETHNNLIHELHEMAIKHDWNEHDKELLG